LFVVVAEVADILQASLEFPVPRVDLDRNEFLIAATSYLTGNICELLDALVPRPENAVDLPHNASELLVIELDQLCSREQTMENFVQVSRNGFHKGQRAADRIRTYPQFLVEVRKDLDDRILDLLKGSSRE
jgi:hypothetical protein